MPDAKLKFNDQEITLGDRIATLGRTPDNTVSFAGDSNVSRYHAEIERRADDFWLIDLDSSNGTKIGEKQIKGETLLADGDVIVLGGTSRVTFEIVKESNAPTVNATSSSAGNAAPTNNASAAQKQEAEIVKESEATSKAPKVLLIAGGLCGLAVICVFAAGLIYYVSGSSACAAKATITSPEPGETLTEATEIAVEIDNAECAERAVFLLDGVEFARATEKPFAATLDPKDFPDLADGVEHNLQIVLEDENGVKMVQPNSVPLAFETREIVKPTPEIVKTETAPTPKAIKGKQISLIDTQEMAKRLVKQFGGNFSYNVSNKQFLAEVQKYSAEYAQAEGYFDRAAQFKDSINVAYVTEQNLNAPLGFILAMSRSKFVLAKQGSEEGLWRMTGEFIAANNYNGVCGAETLSDASQNCAARSSALYLKAIVYGVFDGDQIYSAAAFGKSPQDAGAWKATLPANRADFWAAIKTAPEREQIARFFAAGIVAENPQKFGLKKDRALSELYRITMTQ